MAVEVGGITLSKPHLLPSTNLRRHINERQSEGRVPARSTRSPPMTHQVKTVVVTGASRDIGKATHNSSREKAGTPSQQCVNRPRKMTSLSRQPEARRSKLKQFRSI
jgi:hypothetical protein